MDSNEEFDELEDMFPLARPAKRIDFYTQSLR